MILPDETPSAARDPRPNGAADTDRVLDGLVAPLLDAFRQAWILVQVQSDRSRLALRQAWQEALARSASSFVRAVLALAGGILALLGARGGLQELFAARPWLANLVTGALLLGVTLAWGRTARIRDERDEQRRLAAKYEALEGRQHEHGHENGRPAAGAPGERAGAGAEPARARPGEPAH